MNQHNVKRAANNTEVSEFERLDFEQQEQELAEILSAYRENVHTWSADLMERQRTLQLQRRPASSWSTLTWRVATFALSGIMLAAVATGGVIQYQRNIDAQKIAQQKADEKKALDKKTADEKKAAETQLAANQIQQDDELLSDVDNDIAQQSPAAMEPLAALMNGEDK